MHDLTPLLDALRRGEMPRLALDDVDGLLIWLSGGRHEDGLPNPDHDPVLLQMVFYRLDATLFSGGELKLDAAGVSADHPYENRLLRFRRLNRTFHPDRYPQLGDWLTERSQAVHRAYSLFKRHPESEPLAPLRASVQQPPPGARQRMRPTGPLKRSRRRLRHALLSLRARFGRDRYLPHKLIGGLALIALLPVLNIVLAPGGLEPPGAVVANGDPSTSSVPSSVEEAQSLPRTRSEDGDAPTAERLPPPSPASGRGSNGGTSSALVGGSNGEVSPAHREESNAGGADEPTALLLAARRAMDPDGDGSSEVATLPTVDEQLAAMGLADDTERLYRELNRSHADERRRATAARPREVETRSPSMKVDSDEGKLTVEDLPPPQPSPARGGGSDNGSFPARGGGGDNESFPARGGGSIDRSSTVRGGGSDAEGPVASGGGSSSATGAPVRAGQEGAVPAVASTGPSLPSPPAVGQVRGESGGEEPPPPPPQPSPARGGGSDGGGAPARRGGRDGKGAPGSGRNSASMRPGTLALGPFTSLPAGRTLARLQKAVESGDLPALALLFDDRARHRGERGIDAIRAHYRALFDRTSARALDLRLLKLERDGNRTRIETHWTLRGLIDGEAETLEGGRIEIQLDENDPPRIVRLNSL